MHNNYHYFQGLVPELRQELLKAQLVECFSQSKDELILIFQTEKQGLFHMKASLQPKFSCLSFPREFARTKRNSINLFNEFIQQKLIGIHLFENERSFSFEFENGSSLLFKMHGNRANIISFEEGTASGLFKHNFPNDLEIDLQDIHKSLDQSQEAFIQSEGNYTAVYPTFGKLIKQYLKSIGYFNMSIQEQWIEIEKIKTILDKKEAYYTIQFEGNIYFSLLALGEVLQEETSAIEAITQFYYYYSKEAFLVNEKAILLRALEKRENQLISYIKKTDHKLLEIKNKPGFNQLADIIMANLHAIPPRTKSIELFNFYTEEMVTIQLKEQLSPQKNAENLYRKSKNQQIEIDQLVASIQSKQRELRNLQEEIAKIKEIEEVKDLKKVLKKNKPSKHKQVEERVPYKQFEYKGFTILVGKGARENDELTLKYAKKNDLWLHAKDVTGSHVVLKHQSNKSFSVEVVEKAAQLAAYYSKRKTDSLVPVISTPKKYVRKPKGLPPGKVHVDKEETLLVTTEQWWL